MRALNLSGWFLLVAALASSGAWADALDPKITPLLQRFYPAGQLAQFTSPDYELRTANLNWIQQQQQPLLLLGYHRAVPFYDHGVTLHFSAIVRHEPQSRIVKANYRCQKDYFQQTVQHPRFGPYVLCSKELISLPHVSKAGAGNLHHVTASAYPMAGNSLPHVTLSLHGFANDILPLLTSLTV